MKKLQKKHRGGRASMPKIDARLTLRVLGYLDDGEWAAHCLETDLIGWGETFKEAVEALNELTEMQVSFAIQRNQPSLLDHPAPPEIWQLYERTTSERLRVLGQRRTTETRMLGTLPLSERPGSGRQLAWAGG